MTTPGLALHVSPLGFQPVAYLGLLLITVGTLAGAWSVRRWPHRRVAVLLAACGALLALAVADLLPHAFDEARTAGLPVWAVPAVVVAGYVIVPACGALLAHCGGKRLHGLGIAAALVLHRGIEGMTVDLLPSAPVVAALVVHSGGEGLALAALLDAKGRRRLAPWLALACASPLIGGLATQVAPLPASARALLMAAVVGVLLRGVSTGIAPAVRRIGAPAATLTLVAALAVATVAALVVH